MRLALDVESEVLEFAVTMAKRVKGGLDTFVSSLAYHWAEQDSFEVSSLEYTMHVVNFNTLCNFALCNFDVLLLYQNFLVFFIALILEPYTKYPFNKHVPNETND